MEAQSINRVTWRVLILLSLIALCTVLSGFIYPQAPESDEGAAAHIFQLAVLALVPAGLLFLGTADWRQPARTVRLLAFPAAALLIAFGVLFYVEHYR
jgi:hypothetical protein